jgi:hypothetical protein
VKFLQNPAGIRFPDEKTHVEAKRPFFFELIFALDAIRLPLLFITFDGNMREFFFFLEIIKLPNARGQEKDEAPRQKIEGPRIGLQ